jgi:PKD repeat protein
MKRIFILFLLTFVWQSIVEGQSGTCVESDPFCTGTTYIFPAGVNTGAAEPGANYGCLGSQPNPAWYHMRILEPGSITIQMYSTPLRDIDFILWGPFNDPVSPCVAGLTGNKIVDCSYSASATEIAVIPNGQVGEYYILLITNFSNQPCNITFEKIAGNGETDCTIIPPPVGSNSPVCYGNTIELYADPYPGATYSWVGPAGFMSGQQNPVIPNATFSNAGTYTLIITVNGISSDPISTVVGVFPLPQPAFTFDEVCFGSPTSFTDQSTVIPPDQNITSWHWDFGDGNTSSLSNPTHNYAAPGSYNVTLTTYTSMQQCPRQVTHSVQVYNAPYVDAGDNQEIPNGWTTQLFGNIDGGSGIFDIMWEPAGLLVNPTLINPITLPLSQTVQFTFTVTDQTSGCVDSDNMIVNVTGGALYVQALADPMEICQGQQVQLSAISSGGAGNYTYNWSSNPPGFNANIHNPVHSPDQTTTYTVQVFDGQNTVMNQVTVVVNPKPLANAGANITINSGTATQLHGSVNSGTPPFTYLWSPADSLDNPGVDPFLINPITKNLHAPTQFTFSANDSKGCQAAADQMWVLTEGEFLGVFAESQHHVICFGGSTDLSATAWGGSGEYTFAWTADNSDWEGYGQHITVSPENTTLYSVTVHDGFKYMTASTQVMVNPLPVVELLPAGMQFYTMDTIKVCVRDSIMLDAGAGMEYLWSNNSASRFQRVTTNGNFLDWQTWWVRVTNPVSGCVNYDTITVFFDFASCNIGVDEFVPDHAGIHVYPNPSDGEFSVMFENLKGNISLNLSSIHGQTIWQESKYRITQAGQVVTLNISDYPSGLYLLHIKTDHGYQIRKLIKQQSR